MPTHKKQIKKQLSKIWKIHPVRTEQAKQLSRETGISRIVAQVLLNRNITTSEEAKKFMNPKLTDLLEPNLLPGISEAVERIQRAIKAGEKITIYGDYDADGITSTAILWRLLTMLNTKVNFYIPHRIEEGYGLNTASIEKLAEQGTNLIITVDCGITACGEISRASELGMDVIVTDHHKIENEIPQASAIVHPQLDMNYPSPASAGAMVAFKLAWAVCNEYKDNNDLYPKLKSFLINATKFAAVGTIADVMDLVGENRSLAHFGLKAMSSSDMPGVKALINTARLDGKLLSSRDIAFQIAPMLNASGRLGHARLAVELLTSSSELNSLKIAQYLKQQNNERRKIEREIFKQASQLITTGGYDHPDRKTIVVAGENWHQGVVGIVASRVAETYFRPAIVFNNDGQTCVGSARSVRNFDIYQGISSCAKHLISFGGHAGAAGLRVESKKLPDFIEAFEQHARENILEDEAVSMIDIEGTFEIGDFNERTIQQIQQLSPFGQGNPVPVFAAMGVRLYNTPRIVGEKGTHLQLSIRDRSGFVRCIAFGMGNLEKKLIEADYFNVAFTAELNSFNGNSNLQFNICDIQFE
ncbi:Single-stranded-DNA-specific exonuclease RecJ [Limihaloglobus sulfuriphilus]|uniref:Single-stranded-DNA-specific exonuclease RecJ n=1 Tax=Limihaloglobus sulfuriphilus TaxID=1851148 RepID=A0A1Q2MEW9_9BACT|nr:single-stranded-DNA-specific exonuclease RecJ [Limihaloglobus sulfuriphilus]AQQ70837.1 Single-stranded-DNA-specific exonuclease RecJ [Limihaloglobus sulfuriphilus]